MSVYNAIPTLAGLAAIAAASGPDPVEMVLTDFVVGDGNGNTITPLQTMTSLVNQVYTMPISDYVVEGVLHKIEGTIPLEAGGFTIREIGLKDENGVLMFVAGYPTTQKLLPTEGGYDELYVGLDVAFSPSANITITITGPTYTTVDQVNTIVNAKRTDITTPLWPYLISVISMAVASPPGSPAPGDPYIIPADATGAWAGKAGQLAQYIGASEWKYRSLPAAFVVSDANTGLIYQRRLTPTPAWVPLLPANATTQKLWLQEVTVDGLRVRAWSDPFDIDGLSQRDIALTDKVPFHNAAVGKRQDSVAGLVKLVQNASPGMRLFYSGT